MQHTFFPLAKNNFAFVFWQREISRNFLVTRFMEEMLYVFLAVPFFSLPLLITFVAASISPFSHRRYKIFLFWFLSLALAFFVIHVNVDIEMKSKERIGICCCCFISKRPGSYAITAETSGCLKCKISSRLTWRRGRTYGRSPWKHRSPNFLTHGAPLRAFRAREIRYKKFMRK